MLPYGTFPLRSFKLRSAWDFHTLSRFSTVALVSTGHVEFAFFASVIIEVSGMAGLHRRNSGTELAEFFFVG